MASVHFNWFSKKVQVIVMFRCTSFFHFFVTLPTNIQEILRVAPPRWGGNAHAFFCIFLFFLHFLHFSLQFLRSPIAFFLSPSPHYRSSPLSTAPTPFPQTGPAILPPPTGPGNYRSISPHPIQIQSKPRSLLFVVV